MESPVNEAVFNTDLTELVKEIIDNSLNNSLDYTLFRKFLVKKIDYFFVEPLDEVFREFTRQKIGNILIQMVG